MGVPSGHRETHKEGSAPTWGSSHGGRLCSTVCHTWGPSVPTEPQAGPQPGALTTGHPDRLHAVSTPSSTACAPRSGPLPPVHLEDGVGHGREQVPTLQDVGIPEPQGQQKGGALWGQWAWEEPLEQGTGGPSTGLEAPSASGPCSPTVHQTRSQSCSSGWTKMFPPGLSGSLGPDSTPANPLGGDTSADHDDGSAAPRVDPPFLKGARQKWWVPGTSRWPGPPPGGLWAVLGAPQEGVGISESGVCPSLGIRSGRQGSLGTQCPWAALPG